MPKAKRFYAIVYPDGRSVVVFSWRAAEDMTRGVSGVKHKAFWDRRDCDGWIKRTVAKIKGTGKFYRGTLPDLARTAFRDKLISDQFAIMRDAGLI